MPRKGRGRHASRARPSPYQRGLEPGSQDDIRPSSTTPTSSSSPSITTHPQSYEGIVDDDARVRAAESLPDDGQPCDFGGRWIGGGPRTRAQWQPNGPEGRLCLLDHDTPEHREHLAAWMDQSWDVLDPEDLMEKYGLAVVQHVARRLQRRDPSRCYTPSGFFVSELQKAATRRKRLPTVRDMEPET